MRKIDENIYMKLKEGQTTNNMPDKSYNLEFQFDDDNKVSYKRKRNDIDRFMKKVKKQEKKFTKMIKKDRKTKDVIKFSKNPVPAPRAKKIQPIPTPRTQIKQTQKSSLWLYQII